MKALTTALVVLAMFVTARGKAGTTTSKQNPASPLSFSAIAKLKPGTSTQSDLTRLFGRPDKVTNLETMVGSFQSGERWEYSEGDLDRLTVFLGRDNGPVTSFVFEVHNGDSERALKVAMSRYPESTWQLDTVKWINPHHFPDDCFLKDDAKGIRIEYDVERQEVKSVLRWDPSRKLANVSADEKPPEYCIGGTCSPAMSATEFFKQWPIEEYCKVPKLK